MKNQSDESEKATAKSKRKGTKATRGKPLFYDEKKKKRSVMLTDTVWEMIGDLAQTINKSRSEWLELHVRAICGKK